MASGDLLSEIKDEDGAIGGRGSHLVAAAVPADLENAASAFVRMNLKQNFLIEIIISCNMRHWDQCPMFYNFPNNLEFLQNLSLL